jgi:hypothetical protein
VNCFFMWVKEGPSGVFEIRWINWGILHDQNCPRTAVLCTRFKPLVTYIDGLCLLTRYALQREEKESKARDELEKIKLMAFTYWIIYILWETCSHFLKETRWLLTQLSNCLETAALSVCWNRYVKQWRR